MRYFIPRKHVLLQLSYWRHVCPCSTERFNRFSPLDELYSPSACDNDDRYEYTSQRWRLSEGDTAYDKSEMRPRSGTTETSA